MNQHSSLTASGSLLERAAELYGFAAAPAAPVEAPAASEAAFDEPVFEDPAPAAAAPLVLEMEDEDFLEMPQHRSQPSAVAKRHGRIDRDNLREGGFIMPEAPVSPLAEEFRIIKRQLLQAASGKTGIAEDKRQTLLVCSAGPDEGKTFCAINLALSMASEKDVEVLLVDGDFSKPEILSILGLEGGKGLTDDIAEPGADPEHQPVHP